MISDIPARVADAPTWVRRALRLLLAVLTLGPIAGGFAFVAAYGVNVPFIDDWATGRLLVAQHDGTLSFEHLWGQHNEHRILFPQLAMLGLANLTHWNIVAELYLTQACLLALLIVLVLGARDTLPRRSLLVVVPLLAFLVFTPRQHENFLIGFQVALAFVPLFGVLALYLLHSLRSMRSEALAFAMAVCSGAVASYSAIHGLAVWPAGFFQLWIATGRRRPPKIAVWWAVAAATVVAVFFSGYRKPPGYHQSRLYNLEHPVAATKFLVALLGSSIAYTQRSALLAGAFLVALGIVALVLVVRTRAAPDVALWFGVGVFALGMMFSIAGGRSALGVGWALSSRYSSTATLYVISLLALLALLGVGKRSNLGLALGALGLAVISISAIFVYREGTRLGSETQRQREYYAYLLATRERQPDVFLQSIQPNLGSVREEAAFMQRMRYTLFSSSTPPPAPRPPPSIARLRLVGAASCVIDSVGGASAHRPQPLSVHADRGLLPITGWCRDPLANDIVGGVYVALDRRLYPGTSGTPRPDVAYYLNSERYLYAGFDAAVPFPSRGTHTLSVVPLTRDERGYFGPTQPIVLTVAG